MEFIASEHEVNCEGSPILSSMQIFTILENKDTYALCPLRKQHLQYHSFAAKFRNFLS